MRVTMLEMSAEQGRDGRPDRQRLSFHARPVAPAGQARRGAAPGPVAMSKREGRDEPVTNQNSNDRRSMCGGGRRGGGFLRDNHDAGPTVDHLPPTPATPPPLLLRRPLPLHRSFYANLQHQPQLPPPLRPPARAGGRRRVLEDFSARYALLAGEEHLHPQSAHHPRRRQPGDAFCSRARPEESLILTGITLQEGRHVAFIENSLTHATQRLVPGDSISGLSGRRC